MTSKNWPPGGEPLKKFQESFDFGISSRLEPCIAGVLIPSGISIVEVIDRELTVEKSIADRQNHHGSRRQHNPIHHQKNFWAAIIH